MEWETVGPAVVAGLMGGVCGICGVVVGAFLTAGLAFGQSWVNRRWRRQEERAAEKRERLEERVELVKRYAVVLQGFVHGAAKWMELWKNQKPVEGWERLAGHVRELLEEQWAGVVSIEPRPEPLFLVSDSAARSCLAELLLVVRRCRNRCIECLEAGELMTEEEACGYVAEADHSLEGMLGRMDEVVEEVE